MVEQSNLGDAGEDRDWINKILEIILLNTSVEEHHPTKKRFFEIAFQMFHEGSFYSENDISGTIYLGNFITDDGHFDFYYLESVIRMAIRFMDNEHIRSGRVAEGDLVTIYLDGFQDVFDIEDTTTDKGKDKTYRNLAFFAMRTALIASIELAKERGATKSWENFIGDISKEYGLNKSPIRNAVTVYANSAQNFDSIDSDLT